MAAAKEPMSEPKAIASADDLVFDQDNANLGTDRGLDMIRESIETCGVGRSIVVDKNGVVIAGNKTLQIAKQAGIPVEVVQTTGDDLVVVRRTDLDLVASRKARQLAYYDNRANEVDLKWSSRQIQKDLLAGIDLTSSFFPEELDRLLPSVPPDEVPEDPLASVEVVSAPEPVSVEGADAGSETAEAIEVQEPEPKPHRPSFELVFENITQQIRWTALMRALREKYPDAPSQMARFSQYLTERGVGGAA